MKKDEIINLLEELKLPEIIMDMYKGKEPPEYFRYIYRCPEELFYSSEQELAPFSVKTIKPIFSDDTFSTIYAYNTEKKGYLKYYTEIEENLPEKDVMSWDALFVSEILTWFEYEISNENILELGKKFQLKHTNKLLSELNQLQAEEASYEKFEAWAKRKTEELK